MTSTESKIRRKNSKRDRRNVDSNVESERLSRDEQGNPARFSATHAEGDIESMSSAAADARRKQDNELKRLLDRDARKSSKYGNAIEKQKDRALSHSRPAPEEVYAPGEYEYHTDRIMIAVVAGLVVISLLGWAAYMMFRGEAPAETTQFTATPYTDKTEALKTADLERETAAIGALTENPEAADAANKAVEDTVKDVSSISKEAQQSSESLDALKSALGNTASKPVVAGNKPAELEAPVQPVMNRETAAPAAAPVVNTAPVDTSGDGIFAADKVARMNLARGVKNYEPTDVYNTQTISLEGRGSFRLVFFTQLTNLNGQTVSHRWYYNGAQVASVDINVGSESWRASTNKLVDNTTLGQWRAEIVDTQGQVLARQSFNVTE